METNKKRIIIILIYLIIFGLIIWGIYSIFKPVETCFDGKKNQNEEGIDCGGICQKCRKVDAEPLEVKGLYLVDAGYFDMLDFVAVINNPNKIFGSKKFEYEVIFKDNSGNIVNSKKSSSFILPGEEKYIVETNIKGENISQKEFKILNSDWVEFDGYEKPELSVVEKRYEEISGGVGFSQAKGILKNESPFDFNLIKILVVLKNSEGKIIAANSTEVKTVKSGEKREFTVLWPNKFTGNFSRMEAQAEVNVFNSDEFIKRFYKTSRFQSYE